MGGANSYQLYGLHIDSEIRLPELLPSPGASIVDVKIILVPPVPFAAPGLTSTEEQAQFGVHGVAEYVVTRGSQIIVRPVQGAPERNIRLYLLGSAFGLLLHQRAWLPLHANAIQMGDHAFAFMGHSGAGKSTLAAWFHDVGYNILADDVCVVRFDRHSRPFAMPGLPRLRLWREALERSGRATAQYERSYVDDNSDKFDVPADQKRRSYSPTSLAAVYLLETGPTFEIEKLIGVEAAEALFANTYRGAYVEEVGDTRLHWESCIKLLRRVPLFLVRRSLELSEFHTECEQIRKHAQTVSALTLS